MSIYYTQNQNQSHTQPLPTLQRNEQLRNRSRNQKNTIEMLNSSRENLEASLKKSHGKKAMPTQQQQQEWENIGNINKVKHSPQVSPKQVDFANRQRQVEKKKSKGLKDKLALIIGKFQEENSVAEITHYHEDSDNDSKLQQSTSTIQSNDRRKYRTLPRKLEPTSKNSQVRPQGSIVGKNRQAQLQNQIERDELEFIERSKKQVKSQPKYLFYNIIKEEQPNIEEKQLKMVKNEDPKIKEANRSSAKKQFPMIDLKNQLPDYEYKKGVHPPNQKKKERLKNKLGYIFDLFHKDEEVASVSYYSQSQKESMQNLPKIEPPAAKIQQQKEASEVKNIFHPNVAEEEEFAKPNKILNKIDTEAFPEQNFIYSNEFESLNIPIKPAEDRTEKKQAAPSEPKKQMNSVGESGFQKIKKSIKVNTSLQKVELKMMEASRNRSKSRISATKSVQNKPKASRYEEDDTNEILLQQQSRPKKKSVDLSALSRHIKVSLNRKSSSKNSNEPPNQSDISKSKSEHSKFSIKLVEIEAKKQADIESQSASYQKSSQKQQIDIMPRQQQQFQEEETTVKKMFPIARIQSIPKTNSTTSKHMKINFKDNGSSIRDDIEDEIPSLPIKQTDFIQKSKTLQAHNKPTIKVNIKQNQEIEAQANFKPVNKIEFNIERSKKFKTELIPAKDDLSDQEKKFLALLRKREDALLKRVKEQVKINNPNIILQDTLEERSRQLSNQTFEKVISKEDSSSSNKSPINYYRADRLQKMSLKSDPPQQQTQVKQFFPTLNLSPSAREQQNYQTFYQNHLKKTNSKKSNYNFAKKNEYSDHFSSDTDRKTLDDRFEQTKNYKKQTSKISYYNIKKLQKEANLNERNLNSKEKYERLKQLLEQV